MINYIYILKLDGVAFYIGLTVDLERRFYDHKKTFGDRITIEEIDRHEGSLAAAYLLEEFWIRKYSDMGVMLKNKNSDNTKILKCPECSKDILQTPSKKEKKFCNSTCRSNFWQKNTRKNKELKSPKVEVKDLNAKTNVVKSTEPLGSKKSNYAINTKPCPLVKMIGESGVDFRIRVAEWEEQNK